MASGSLSWAMGLSLAVASLGVAQAQMAKPAPVSKFLEPGELDPALILPPPPADDSPRTAAEIAELIRLGASRSPERLAQAEHDARVEDVTAIATALSAPLPLDSLPATARLFADVLNEDDVAAKVAKTLFHRVRPWAVDATLGASPALKDCDKGDPKSSYPSGHATMGYAAAAVLARLMPSHAQALLARASDYAESRLVCGVHYRSDTEAAHVLATALVARLMTKPAFRTELEAARAELQAAHLAP